MNCRINHWPLFFALMGVLFISSCNEFEKDEAISIEAISEVITDIDGNTYNATSIGNQTWMAENLQVTHFRNGDPILHVTSNYQWFEAGRDGVPAWRYYNDDPSLAEKYGILYNGFAVSDPRGLGPEGWKVPGDSDWEEFLITIGGEKPSSPTTITLKGHGEFAKIFNERVISYRWVVEDEDLNNQLEWENSDNRSIFDASGFNLVAAGEVDRYGNFYDIDKRVKFWSYPTEKFYESFSDGSGSKHAMIKMGTIPKEVMHTRCSAPKGISVRLIKE